MLISRKCQYALRAVLELAYRDGTHPVKIHEIAGAQNIPPRFLEVILNQLRHAGFVESRRGNEGGYMLAKPAGEVTVGQIIESVQGTGLREPSEPRRAGSAEYFFGDYAFERVWKSVGAAISGVCDNTTLADLIEYENVKNRTTVPDYVI
jgi:Rrf2 family protein